MTSRLVVEIPEPHRELSATSRLYTDDGQPLPPPRRRVPYGCRPGLLASGLPRYLVEAADSRWDKAIPLFHGRSHRPGGRTWAYPSSSSATVTLPVGAEDKVAAISGPVVSTVPTGDAAVALRDLVAALAWMPGFFELKRTRTRSPQLLR